ncbi:MAG: Exo-poly-alpha-D-galacturonosidase precursor [Firmicutes bacterium ADurb.Bin146]|nr:MAG: Exo-poly-alpha-D-galacturonosidase precursor [Firmicutes bacterium ADurb.Bin146]
MNRLQSLYDETAGNGISPVQYMPKTPLTSRFVSPWDTSGWYSVKCNFQKGALLYSNCTDTVKDIDECYAGADYIQTFNSKAINLIDHPELDFFVETYADVTVAMEESCKPEWLKTWINTERIMTSSKGTKYCLYTKEFTKGAHVNIPGFDTDHNHYIVIIKPLSNKEKLHGIVKINYPNAQLQTYKKRPYKSHLVEVFNKKNDGIFTNEYQSYGCCSIQTDKDDKENKYLALETTDKCNKAYVKKIIDTKLVYPYIFECKLNISKHSVVKAFLVDNKGNNIGALFNNDGYVYNAEKDTKICPFQEDTDITLKLKADSKKKTYEIWINHIKQADAIPFNFDSINYILFYIESKKSLSHAYIDNIYLYDDTEIYAVNERFEKDDLKNWSSNSQLTIEPYPFNKDRSLALTGKKEASYATYGFSPIDDTVSIETKVKVTDESFSLLPQLADKDGKAVLNIAMYKNNLYATDGQKWKRIYEGLTPWMYYPCNNWFNIKVTADIKKSTYDLYIDGAKRAQEFNFMNKVSNIGQMAFSCEKSSKIYINRIRISDCADFSRGMLPNAKIFDVKKAPYNAKGDGRTLDTEKIQKAIDDAAYTGGTVYIHDGVFFTGGLILKSDMTLFIDKSATVLGTQDHSQYKLVSPGISLCAIRQLGRGLIYGENVSNVRITGGGTLDGNGTYRYKMNDPLQNREADARPDIVYITYSKDITIENVDMKSSAFWTVVPLSSGNITIRNLNLDCMNTPNRDGIDPVDCHDMTIYNCNIMAGDDGLCFKSSDNVGCYNIDAFDLMIQSLASGIKFGTDTYYCLKNARIRDCAIKNVNRCGVSLETVDGAAVEDVVFERLDMTDVGAPLYITVGARNRLPRGGQPIRRSYIKNVTFKDIRFEQPYPFSFTRDIRENMVIGQSKDQLIENVHFENFDLKLPGGMKSKPKPPVVINDKYPEYDRHGLSSGHAFTIKYAKNITFKNIKVTLEKKDAREETAYFDYED